MPDFAFFEAFRYTVVVMPKVTPAGAARAGSKTVAKASPAKSKTASKPAAKAPAAKSAPSKPQFFAHVTGSGQMPVSHSSPV